MSSKFLLSVSLVKKVLADHSSVVLAGWLVLTIMRAKQEVQSFSRLSRLDSSVALTQSLYLICGFPIRHVQTAVTLPVTEMTKFTLDL